MKVSLEAITVLAPADALELTLLMGGHRLTLSLDEARALVEALQPAIARTTDGASVFHDQSRRDQGAKGASIVEKVTEQLISWSQIANTLNPRK